MTNLFRLCAARNRNVIILFALMFCLLSAPAFAKVVSEKIDYEENGEALQGVLYYDDAWTDNRPGVIVVHEWKGLGDYSKKRAEMLAELGYAAFAADMYGKGVFAEDHEEAGKLSGVYFKDRNRMRARAAAAYNAFVKTGKADQNNLAAIGYCFGGTTVLEMARAGFPLKGVISFHGVLATPAPAEKGRVEAKVRVMNGAADRMISAADVEAFEKEMADAGVDSKVTNFPGAMHSFTVWDANSPDRGSQYNEAADKESWAMLQDFFKEIFPPA